MNLVINAQRITEIIRLVLLQAALAEKHYALNLDYMPVGEGGFNALFINTLQFKGFLRRSDVEITRRCRVWIDASTADIVEVDYLQREGPNDMQDVQKFTHTYLLGPNITVEDIAGKISRYLATGELKEGVVILFNKGKT